MNYNIKYIHIKGARENNLNNIDVKIPRNKLVVITGLSGSGKSTLAFDTIYAEGQRRYVESLSTYARQFLGLMEKPDIDYIEGLSPAISIEQKSTSKNPRSTVGTITEIYDYFRLLFARIGNQKCYKCNGYIKKQSAQQIVDKLLQYDKKTKFQILAPIIRGKKGEFKDVIASIYKEGFVRARIDGEIINLSEKIRLKKTKKHHIEIIIDRLIMDDGIKDRLSSSIELGLKIGKGLIIIDKFENNEELYSEIASCHNCDISFEELQPRDFSFNSPFGACKNCDGLGSKMSLDYDLIVPNENLSLSQGCIKPIGEQPKGTWYGEILISLSKFYGFSFKTPWFQLDNKIKNVILNGTKESLLVKKPKSSIFKGEFNIAFEGIISNLERRYIQTKSGRARDWIEKFMTIQICKSCKGSRLNKISKSVYLNKKNISDLTNLTIGQLLTFFNNLILSKKDTQISKQITKEIQSRLSFLNNVGLDYLTLSRAANTLSGGETQRIRLATQIGSQLVGVLYILDEPSIGLHQRDNKRLIDTLINLRNLGNTVIVVEHDENTIRSADWVIDIGPKAGKYGGNVISSGPPKDIERDEKSLTGQYLSGSKTITYSPNKRKGNGKVLTLYNASGNNLKSVNLKLPLGKFISVTGVSGSGKSTLINNTLYPILAKEYFSNTLKPLPYKDIHGLFYLDKVININQSPIGKTPRSNPATYTGLFTHIRDLFSQLPDSKILGYKPGRFSFNVKGGRCETCQGVGLIKIEMHFLADMYIQCESCKGKRFNNETLQIKYKTKNVYDILEMTVEEAQKFFKNHINIVRKLNTLYEVGLGYIKLGQQATTLSGGESQRVKLSTELSKVNTGRTLYLLDEPTTGLHFHDVNMLLSVLNNLVDKGNTVLVIEHNMDIIKSSDWIIDLGPEGGDRGGQIIATGTPKQIMKYKSSYTGKHLIDAIK